MYFVHELFLYPAFYKKHRRTSCRDGVDTKYGKGKFRVIKRYGLNMICGVQTAIQTSAAKSGCPKIRGDLEDEVWIKKTVEGKLFKLVIRNFNIIHLYTLTVQ